IVCIVALYAHVHRPALHSFPTRRSSDLGEGADEVRALHAALEAVLLELGCYRREERQFTPHITLGRVKQESGDDLSVMLAKKARSEEHTSNSSHGSISYAVFCLKKKKKE